MTDRRTIVASIPTDRVAHCGARRTSHLGVAFALGLAVALWPGHAAPVQAATVVVTNRADSGPGSLRQAIADASPGDAITFAGAASSGTITLTSGELVISTSLTIAGPGATALTISGNSLSRVFDIGAGADVEIDDVTISRGDVDFNHDPSAFFLHGYAGGGIYNLGRLTLRHGAVTENVGGIGVSANPTNPGGPLSGGGGIYNGGTLIVDTSAITGNTEQSGLPIGRGGNAGPPGGGVYNDGTLTVTNSTIDDNSASPGDGGGAPGGNGGGIYTSPTGTTVISRSTLAGNTAGRGGPGPGYGCARPRSDGAGGGGGAIANDGALTVDASTIVGNSAGAGNIVCSSPVGGPGGSGGGIYNTGTLTISTTTVTGNTGGSAGTSHSNPGTGVADGVRGGDGGGIANQGGDITLVNTTIEGDRAGTGGDSVLDYPNTPGGQGGGGGNGGGIANIDPFPNRNTYPYPPPMPGSVKIVASTIAHNDSGNGGHGVMGYGQGGVGGGVYNEQGGVTIRATILAENAATTGSDCAGNATSTGYNLIRTTVGCTITGDTIGNIDGQNPLLGPLQNNGGPTPTLLPFAGSPAIDQIPPDRCTTATDQRGDARPADGGTGRAYCDIGSVEVNGAALASPPVAATPELGSGELLATGLLPLGLALLARRRRARQR